VRAYLEVFKERFRELKDKEVVLRKLQEKEFDERNIKTIKDYNPLNNYTLLVQAN